MLFIYFVCCETHVVGENTLVGFTMYLHSFIMYLIEIFNQRQRRQQLT